MAYGRKWKRVTLIILQRPYINFLSTILIFGSKNDSLKSGGGYTSYKAFLNSPPPFIAMKSSIKRKRLPHFRDDIRPFLFLSKSTYHHSNRGTS